MNPKVSWSFFNKDNSPTSVGTKTMDVVHFEKEKKRKKEKEREQKKQKQTTVWGGYPNQNEQEKKINKDVF